MFNILLNYNRRKGVQKMEKKTYFIFWEEVLINLPMPIETDNENNVLMEAKKIVENFNFEGNFNVYRMDKNHLIDEHLSFKRGTFNKDDYTLPEDIYTANRWEVKRKEKKNSTTYKDYKKDLERALSLISKLLENNQDRDTISALILMDWDTRVAQKEIEKIKEHLGL